MVIERREVDVLGRGPHGRGSRDGVGFDAIHVDCACGKGETELWFNNGELDSWRCSHCGRRYALEHPQPPDLVVYKPDDAPW